MSTISVLETTTAGQGLPPGREPVSLVAFLRSENLRLQNHAAGLERDIAALREILQRADALCQPSMRPAGPGR